MEFINTIVNNTTAYNGQSNKLTDHLRVVYSKEILYNSLPFMHFLQLANERQELGTQAGLTISMYTYDDLSGGGALTEGVPMSTVALGGNTRTITVQEFGNAISITELALNASFTNVMDDVVTLLSRNVAKTIDVTLRNVACAGATIAGKTTPLIYGRKDTSTAKIASIGSVAANTHTFSVTVIRDAVELLQTANCPKFNNSYYVGVLHPHVERTLMDDPAWTNVQNYASPENMLNGECGKINNVRFLSTTLMPNGACASADPAYDVALDGTGASSIDVYKSIIMGENYFGYAVGLPVELRDGGVIDLGRMHVMGWYSIFGSAILNPERAVIIITC